MTPDPHATPESRLAVAMERLRRAHDQLIVMERMASLGGLTAGIAHEIKNPLNFVNNFADLSNDLVAELREGLAKVLEDPAAAGATIEDLGYILDDLQQNVTKIVEHGKRADSIVRGMLQHARGRADEFIPTDINSLLAEYVNLAYHGLRAQDPAFNVTLDLAYDPGAGVVEVVPQDISRVFLNLVNNACYAAHQKKLKFEDDGKSFAPTLTVRSENLGDRVKIRIRDNGNGIADSARHRLFEKFYTTKPSGQGTGLGLCMSRDIVVRDHGGDMGLESVEGEFAEFHLTLPRHRAMKGATAE